MAVSVFVTNPHFIAYAAGAFCRTIERRTFNNGVVGAQLM